MVPISQTFKDAIVNAHNEIRDKVASGKVPNHSSASRMATMQWDPELAELATLNSKRCMSHDKCRDTESFRYSGQNIYMSGWTGQVQDSEAIEQDILNGIGSWFSENVNSSMKYIDEFQDTGDKDKVIGHFTVMVADRNTKVGCGAVTYTKGAWTYLYSNCNYATTNMETCKIYTSGPAASECKKKNSVYPNLCSTEEEYLVNEFSDTDCNWGK